jgi:hypothetical protein
MIQEEETWPNGFSIHVPYYRLSPYQSQTYEFYATRKSSYGNTETITTQGTWSFKIDNPTWFSMSQDKNKLTVTFNAPSSVPTSDRASQSYINVIFKYNGVESYAGSSVGLSWQ